MQCAVLSANHQSLPGDIGRGHFNVFQKLFLHSIFNMYTDYGYQNQLLCSPCLNTCFMCSCWALSRSLTTNLGVANIKTQVSSSHYMNTSLTAQERCRSCHLGPHLLYRRLCAAMSMSMNHKLWQVVMLVHSFKYPPKKNHTMWTGGRRCEASKCAARNTVKNWYKYSEN